MHNLNSEVEKNQQLVKVNDILFYTYNVNCEKWTVTELFDGGFVAIDSEDKEDFFFFKDLQIGWSFSEKNTIM